MIKVEKKDKEFIVKIIGDPEDVLNEFSGAIVGMINNLTNDMHASESIALLRLVFERTVNRYGTEEIVIKNMSEDESDNDVNSEYQPKHDAIEIEKKLS